MKVTFFLHAASEAVGLLPSRGSGKEKGSHWKGLRLEGLVGTLHFEPAQPPCLLIWECTSTNKKHKAADAVCPRRSCKELQHILLALLPPPIAGEGKEEEEKIRRDFCCYEPLTLTEFHICLPPPREGGQSIHQSSISEHLFFLILLRCFLKFRMFLGLANHFPSSLTAIRWNTWANIWSKA